MKNLTWQNPEQLFVAQELINKVKSKCCGIKVYKETNKGLEWHKDADKYGNFIINKHKSDVGIFIPWKELSK